MLLVAAFCINSCNDDDDYDWKNIEAGKQRISRADADTSKIKLDSIKGDNTSEKKYVAIARGGSEYNWVAKSSFLIVTVNNEEPYKVSIKADSKVDTFTWLWVQEKSRNGKLSEPDSLKIKVFGFCTYNIDDLLGSGDFQSKMTLYAPYNVKLTKLSNDTIVNNNFFNMRWNVKYVLTKTSEEKVTIAPNQRFLYNEEMVEVKGSGTYNTCKGRLEVNYAITKVNAGDTIRLGSGLEVLQRN
jgi:hypothetical protein